jgi:hypothetical protein
MERKTFATTLFMSIVGFIFIIMAIGILVFNIFKFFENKYIQNHGLPITATIIYKSIDDYDRSYTYRTRNDGLSTISYIIEYNVNGVDYSYSCESTIRSYREDDTITIYCLANNPEKVVVPLEKGNGILQTIIVCPIFLLLGIPCIKFYNVFTYKRENL